MLIPSKKDDDKSLLKSLRSKLAPVLLRRNAEAFYKRSPKTVGVMKPNGIGNTFNGTISGGEPGPGFVEAKSLDKGSRAAGELRLETPRELARTQIHPPR